MGIDLVYDEHRDPHQHLTTEALAKKLTSLLEYISETLVLDSLTLSCLIEEEYLIQLAHEEGPFVYLIPAVRALNVSPRFELLTYIKTTGETNDNCDPPQRQRHERELNKEYAPKLRELLKPDSLRRSLTETEKYSRSRPGVSDSANSSAAKNDDSESDGVIEENEDSEEDDDSYDSEEDGDSEQQSEQESDD